MSDSIRLQNLMHCSLIDLECAAAVEPDAAKKEKAFYKFCFEKYPHMKPYFEKAGIKEKDDPPKPAADEAAKSDKKSEKKDEKADEKKEKKKKKKNPYAIVGSGSEQAQQYDGLMKNIVVLVEFFCDPYHFNLYTRVVIVNNEETMKYEPFYKSFLPAWIDFLETKISLGEETKEAWQELNVRFVTEANDFTQRKKNRIQQAYVEDHKK